MLSYQHRYHAGNEGDLLKHFALFAVLDYFRARGKTFHYIDTHAGEGLYSFFTEEAQKTGEGQRALRLFMAKNITLPLPLAFFQDFLGLYVKNGFYHSSAELVVKLAPKDTLLHLYELHPQSFAALKNHFVGQKKVHSYFQDGFKGLLSLLPPMPRRALILMDPPYERLEEYDQVARVITEAQRKFATGTYIIWYPILSATREKGQAGITLIKKLRSLNDRYVHLRLQWKKGGTGMLGSGVWVINPTYTFLKTARDSLPLLAQFLEGEAKMNYEIEHGVL